MAAPGERGHVGEPSVSWRRIPAWGDRVPQSPGVVWALRPAHEPSGDTTHVRRTHGIGARATKRRPLRRPGGRRRVAASRGTWGSEAQASYGRAGDVGRSVLVGTIHERDAALAKRVTSPPGQHVWVAAALPEEPHACLAHVRVCGGRMGNHRLYPAADGPHDRFFPTRVSVACGPPLTAGVRLLKLHGMPCWKNVA